MSNQTLSYWVNVIMQLVLLICIWWMSAWLQHYFNLPVSAGVVGLFLLLLGLLSGLFKLEWIKTGSDFILGELVLFFIPCVVGLMNYKNLFMTEGWQLLGAVGLGTLCVMVVTAATVHLCFQGERWLKQHKTSRKRTAQHGVKS